MVKRLYVILDDNEYDELLKAKGNKTWKEFFKELLEFKKKMEEEGETVPRESVKAPYVELAKTLKKLGSLLKVVHKHGEFRHIEDWEYEAAALLPLFIADERLSEEEKRELGAVMVDTLWSILDELYPARAEELKWLAQALRMLFKGHKELYDSSIENFIEAWSRRQAPSLN